MKLTFTAVELAQTLGLSVATVYQYATKQPDRLPPKLNTPGRRLLWLSEDVHTWIESHKKQPPQTAEAAEGATAS